MSDESELVARIEPYKARPGEAKKYTNNPCALCGWNREMQIHQNPDLIGKGPYHDFVEPTTGSSK